MSAHLFGAINASNIPHHEKSQIRHYLDKITGGKASQVMDSSHGYLSNLKHNGLSTLVAGTEGFGFGATLGFVEAEVGLDLGPIPLDLVSGFFALAASAATGSQHASNVGVSAMSVFGYRKVLSFLKAKKAVTSPSVHGESDDMGEDPIIKFAKDL